MSKIRINELARQLEIPSHEVLEMLPELGVQEKKTHSSSIDEPVAEIIRQRVQVRVHAPAEQPQADHEPAVAVAEPEPDKPHAPAPAAVQEHHAPVAKSAPPVV